MGAYTDRKTFYRSLAEENKLISHGHPVSEDTPEILRESFFTVDDPENLAAGVSNAIHFPCLVMVSLAGRLVSKKESVRRQWSNTLWILHKGQGNSDNAKIDDAYSTSEDAMNQLMSKMLYEMEENGSCGPFRNLDASSFQFDMTGDILDGIYGWQLTITDEASAKDITDFDETKWHTD